MFQKFPSPNQLKYHTQPVKHARSRTWTYKKNLLSKSCSDALGSICALHFWWKLSYRCSTSTDVQTPFYFRAFSFYNVSIVPTQELCTYINIGGINTRIYLYIQYENEAVMPNLQHAFRLTLIGVGISETWCRWPVVNRCLCRRLCSHVYRHRRLDHCLRFRNGRRRSNVCNRHRPPTDKESFLGPTWFKPMQKWFMAMQIEVQNIRQHYFKSR
jgi:hypothetical protein